jgi:tRNA (guanine-N7-)-methyltransferase
MTSPSPSDLARMEAPKTARGYQEAAPRAPEAGLDLVELFRGCDEIELEIGFGRGQFLIQRRAAAPNAGLLGIEIKSKWSFLVAQRIAKLALPNLHAFYGDARTILPTLRPDASIARVIMCFPDPWWKKRHAERRMMDVGLLDQFARLLRDGGEVFVQTDVEERAQEYIARLSAHPDFELATASGLIDENPYGAQSNRETRAIADGLPIYRVLARRKPRS